MNPLLAMFGMQAAQGAVQGLLQRKDMFEQNKAIAEANLANINAAKKSILNVQMQQNFARQQAAASIDSARRAALSAGGVFEAEAAAAGVRGASVDAVQMDIERELGENVDQQRADAVMTEFNLNAEISNIANSTRMNLTPLHKIPSVGSTLVRAAVGAGISTGAAYAASRFQFGSSSSAPGATANRMGSFKNSLKN